MHRCDFCNVMFNARPQVKRPRACKDCQLERQQENERAWHSEHRSGFDAQYHRSQKVDRFKTLKAVADEISKLVDIGKTFLGERVELAGMVTFFYRFLVHIGIRRVNKFWPCRKPLAGKPIQGELLQKKT